ncbi:MAG TPA: hypothetical protein VNB06_21170, partial [Thermoanaerobaculia bacterium]|nr:hypothetical protein [Thermoanaerobaculia bacterium]
MRTKSTATELVLACLVCLLAAPALAAEEAAAEDGWSGVVTPRFILFDFSGGAGDERAHFLERYQLRYGLAGDDRSGLDFDLDLDLTYSKGPRDLFTLERRGEGKYNNHTDGRFNAEKVAVTGYYSRYRSATGGIGFLYNPNQAPGGTDPTYNTPPQTNSGYVSRFNDDSGRTVYESGRETFGLGLRLKPALVGEIATVELRHDGYQRDGNRFSPWIAGGSDFSGPARQLERWRGFDQPVDETLGQLSLAFTLSPGGLFELAYVGASEDFDNQARSFTIGDFAALLSPGHAVAGTNGTKPLHFVPDATLTTHS